MPTPQFDIQNVLKRAQQLDISPEFEPYSGVEILTGAKDEQGNEIVYTAGDASGRVLTISNPWGTQAQAENILNSIRGFTYQPYTARAALLDPSAELGDGVSVNDVYSGIHTMSRKFSSLMDADISAPQSEDIDHEYPFESKQNREFTRRFSAMESELAINSSEISAKVSATGGERQSVSWSLTAQDWSVYANGNRVFRVTPDGAEVNGKITATSGKIGGFDIGSTAISYNGLTWNGTKTGIYLGTSGLQIGNANGSYFQASNAGNVVARNMTLLGTLSFKDSQGNTITMNANNLRAGAQSAYSNGGSWSSARDSWNDAKTPGTASYPSTFKCGTLTTMNGLTINGTLSWGNYTIGRTTIRDYNGTTRNVLSWAQG